MPGRAQPTGRGNPTAGRSGNERLTLLDAIFAQGGITVAFQPIVCVSESEVALHSLESLSRGPKGTNLECADVLFDYVRRKQKEVEVDRLCVRQALSTVVTVATCPAISINVHASTLQRDPSFPLFVCDTADQLGIDRRNLIVEITEHSPVWDGSRFRQALVALRSDGIRIALDDIGLGQSNYKMILETAPDIFKVDRFIVAGCSEDRRRIAVLESIRRMAADLGGSVIAEGVETAADSAALSRIGIDLMQGYLFSRALLADELDAFSRSVLPLVDMRSVTSG
jgi:EAL domain-containing protein (putative c-di-GMP-specific phosphodiesterase class I)